MTVLQGKYLGSTAHLDPHTSDRAIHTASQLSLDPELSGFSEGSSRMITFQTNRARKCGPDGSSVFALIMTFQPGYSKFQLKKL